MMKITVGEPLLVAKYRDVYNLKIELMHGDADSYSTEGFRVRATNGTEMLYLSDVLEVLEFVVEQERTGYVDMDRGEFRGLVAAEFLDAFGDQRLSNVLEAICHHDVTDGGYNHYAAIEGYTLTYFDDSGVEHACSVSKEA